MSVTAAQVIKLIYSDLQKSLPMDDSGFIADLYSHGLLPGDSKAMIESESTSVNKASYFLDHVVEPSCKFGEGDVLCKLLKVLKIFDYGLAQAFRNRIPQDVLQEDELDG